MTTKIKPFRLTDSDLKNLMAIGEMTNVNNQTELIRLALLNYHQYLIETT